MRVYRRLHVRLPKRHRDKLGNVLRGGIQAVGVVLRPFALSQLHQGKAASEVADHVRLTSKAVREIGRRYQDSGLDCALHDRQRPGAAALLDHSQRQRIIAMVCADPPPGYARWTVRLVAEEAVKRKLVPGQDARQFGSGCKNTTFSRGGKKMWCIAELDDEYIKAMEDVLEVYERPLSAEEPVVCVDEKPVTLHNDVREPLPMKPGSVAKRDNEYERAGTANVFCGIEPQAGVHFTKVTPTRSSLQFTASIQPIATRYR